MTSLSSIQMTKVNVGKHFIFLISRFLWVFPSCFNNISYKEPEKGIYSMEHSKLVAKAFVSMNHRLILQCLYTTAMETAV